MSCTPRFHPAPLALAIALTLASQGLLGTAHAQSGGTPVDITLPAQPLGAALNELARQARLQLMVSPELVVGKTAPALSGRLTVQQALERLLSGSGLVADLNGGEVIVRKAPVSVSSSGEAAALPEVSVTASVLPEKATGPVRGLVAKRSATASKTDTALLETPQSISVISREQIEARGATSVEEALRYTAGVTVPYGFDSRYDWTSLRGFDALNAVFRDGLQQPTAGFGVPRVDAYALERVEVLRGPSSVLYGGADPGGIINLVSKKPTADVQHELRLRIGSHNLREAAVDLSGPLNEGQDLLYRVVALSNDTHTQVDQTGNLRQMVAPSLTWKPSAATELTLLSLYQRDAGIFGFDSHASPYALQYLRPLGLTQDLGPGFYTGETSFDRFKREYGALGYQVSHVANDTWTLRQNLRLDRVNTDYKYTQLVSFYPFDAQILQRNASFKDESSHGLAIDNQAEARFTTGIVSHQVLLGLDYRRSTASTRELTGAASNLDTRVPVFGIPIGPLVPKSDLIERGRQLGVYAQNQLSLGKYWRFTLGGRHDWSHLDNDYRFGGTSSHTKDEAFSGRAGVVLVTDIGLAPYASYNTSFKPVTGVNPDDGAAFRPETGKQVELGLKFEPKGTKASFRAALFNIVKSNYVTTDYSTDPAGIRRQIGEVRSRGLELEAQAELLRGLQFGAQYSFTDAQVTQSRNTWQQGHRLNNAPRHTAGAWLDYTQAGGPGDGLGAGIGVRHVGGSEYRDSNTLFPYNGLLQFAGSPLMGSSVAVKTPGYTLTDLSLHYRLQDVKLALNVSNLFDKEHDTGCTEAICYRGYGRTLTATLSYAF